MEILYIVILVGFWLFKAFNESKKKQKESERKRAEASQEQGRVERPAESDHWENEQPKQKSRPSLEDILKELAGVETIEAEVKEEKQPEIILEDPDLNRKPQYQDVVREVNRPQRIEPIIEPKKITIKREVVKSDSSKVNQLKQDDLYNQREKKRNRKKRKHSSIRYFLKKEFNLKHAIVAQAILDPPYIKD